MSNDTIAELETEVLDNAAPVEQPVKKSKGRPNIHPFAGRTYLLKNELNAAMSDKQGFVRLMEETYALSDDRRKQLGSIADAPKVLSFTIHGPIVEVIDQLHRLRAVYGSKTKINISKERMVAPTSSLYMQPITEVLNAANNKQTMRRMFEEYRSDSIYGYVEVPL